MLNVGDKVIIQTDGAFESKKRLLNGHTCVITDICDRRHLFPEMDPRYHVLYGLYWFPEDNPGRHLHIVPNLYFWYEKDFAPLPSFIGLLESTGLPEL